MSAGTLPARHPLDPLLDAWAGITAAMFTCGALGWLPITPLFVFIPLGITMLLAIAKD